VIAARIVGPAGRVVCFEPLPANAGQIEYNARLNGFSNITVRAEALGGSNRTEVFQTSAEPTWGMLSTVGKSPVQASGQIGVEVRTLDSLCKAHGLPPPDVIKMDIEGAEAEALQGAAETLRRSRPLMVIELHSTNAAVCTMLESLGYVAAVLGSSVPVEDVDWDANILAVPQERRELLETMARSPERSVFR
jgi:FkbM family methyltransferase